MENGEIAAVMIDDEAVLKRVYKKDSLLILQSENAKYQPIILHDEELNGTHIVGKLIKVIISM